MTTINEAILDTLRTPTYKEPKHRELLESLGYDVKNTHNDWRCDRWSVNGVEVCKDGTLYARLGSGTVMGLANLKKVDWADYFAKRDARRKAIRRDESIYTEHRARDWRYCNREVREYLHLRGIADGDYHRDTDVAYAQARVEDAERDIERARERLEKAIKYRNEAVENKLKAEVELHEWLVARGVRKEA